MTGAANDAGSGGGSGGRSDAGSGGLAPTWIDSHCHLASLTDGPAAVIEQAHAAGVVAMVCVGTDLVSSADALQLAERHPDVWATVGLHPHDASRLDEEWEALETLAGSAGVVGVGETGFDLHYHHSPVAEQDASFRAHIGLAHRTGLALVVHTRSAWDETFAVLADEGVPARTVFHCFSGGPDEARRALDLGAFLSFSGIVSFKNADDVRAAAAVTPPDRMLVETDAPFLAPVPHRGSENQPAWVPDVGAALAAATGRSLSEVADATRANARTVFGNHL